MTTLRQRKTDQVTVDLIAAELERLGAERLQHETVRLQWFVHGTIGLITCFTIILVIWQFAIICKQLIRLTWWCCFIPPEEDFRGEYRPTPAQPEEEQTLEEVSTPRVYIRRTVPSAVHD